MRSALERTHLRHPSSVAEDAQAGIGAAGARRVRAGWEERGRRRNERVHLRRRERAGDLSQRSREEQQREQESVSHAVGDLLLKG